MTAPGDLWFEEKLALAEQSTKELQAVAPLVANALKAWGDVAVAVAGHDLNNVHHVVRGEQELNKSRDSRVDTLRGEMRAVLARLDTIEETLARLAADLAQLVAAQRRLAPPYHPGASDPDDPTGRG